MEWVVCVLLAFVLAFAIVIGVLWKALGTQISLREVREGDLAEALRLKTEYRDKWLEAVDQRDIWETSYRSLWDQLEAARKVLAIPTDEDD